MGEQEVQLKESKLPWAWAVFGLPTWTDEFRLVAVYTDMKDVDAFEKAEAANGLYIEGSLNHQQLPMQAIADMLVQERIRQLAPLRKAAL